MLEMACMEGVRAQHAAGRSGRLQAYQRASKEGGDRAEVNLGNGGVMVIDGRYCAEARKLTNVEKDDGAVDDAGFGHSGSRRKRAKFAAVREARWICRRPRSTDTR